MKEFDIKKIICDNVKFYREQKNFTQKKMAEELFISLSSYQKLEQGQRNFSTSQLYSIGQILDVDVAYLYHRNIENIDNSKNTARSIFKKLLEYWGINDFTEKDISALINDLKKYGRGMIYISPHIKKNKLNIEKMKYELKTETAQAIEAYKKEINYESMNARDNVITSTFTQTTKEQEEKPKKQPKGKLKEKIYRYKDIYEDEYVITLSQARLMKFTLLEYISYLGNIGEFQADLAQYSFDEFFFCSTDDFYIMYEQEEAEEILNKLLEQKYTGNCSDVFSLVEVKRMRRVLLEYICNVGLIEDYCKKKNITEKKYSKRANKIFKGYVTNEMWDDEF